MKCQFCSSDVTSTVEYNNTVLGYLICALLILSLGLFGAIISAFVFPLCRSANHRCPKCYNLIVSNMFLGLPTMQDQVIALNVGSFAVILTRKLLLIFAVTSGAAIVLFLVARHRIMEAQFAPQVSVAVTSIQWDEYRKNCGLQAFLSEPQKAVNTFMRDYRFEVVGWSGYIANIIVNANNHEHGEDHTCIILVKMQPDDYNHTISLALALSKRVYERHKLELSQAHNGDRLDFNATLMGIGTDRQLFHLHAAGVKLSGEHVDLPKNMVAYGRYERGFDEPPN